MLKYVIQFNVIEYILKHINNDCDKAIFNLQRNENNALINEVQAYQASPYVCSDEIAWQIFSFPSHERYPSVTHLSVRLESEESIYFNQKYLHKRNNNTLNNFNSTLSLYETDIFTKSLLYHEVQEYYEWDNIPEK